MESYKIKSCYINLDRSIKRRQNFTEQTEKNKIVVERFSATDGSKITFRRLQNNRLMTHIDKKYLDVTIGGNIATLLSHVKLWRQFGQSKENTHLVVFEDDVILPMNWNSKLCEIVKKAPKNFDFLYLYHSRKIEGEEVDNLFLKPSPTMAAHVNTGFVAYMIKKSAAHLLASKILPLNCQNIMKSSRLKYVDHHIKHYYKLLNFYIYKPSIVNHNNNLKSDRKSAKQIKHQMANTKQAPK